MRDAEKTVGNMIDKEKTIFVGSVDAEGFPNIKAMLQTRKGKGSNTFTYQRTPRRCAFRNFSKITGHAFTSATHASSRA